MWIKHRIGKSIGIYFMTTINESSTPIDKTQIPVLGDMDLATLNHQGKNIIDWICDYKAKPEQYPVFSRSKAGDIQKALPKSAPRNAEQMDSILSDFKNIILPGITHWNHPGFHAYFGITGSGPGILGDLLASAINVNVMLWRTSPAATELEEVVLDWLRQMMGLPEQFKGVIMDTASMATLVAIATAREKLDLHIRELGTAGRSDLPRLRLYTSEEAHSSVEKAAITLGIGQLNVVKISTDEEFRLDVDLLEKAIQSDIQQGYKPFCVVATVGTTSTTSIDPVEKIATICKQFDLWLHIDAAYGGTAAIVPELQHVLAGCEHADSFVANPHKWLFTPIDCSAFYVRDPALLKRAFSLVPEYLKSNDDDVTNYMDWGVQLGRRFRSLKLWMVIRHFGINGLINRIRDHINIAQELAELIDAHTDFERLAPTPFSTLCFRYNPQANSSTTTTQNDLDRINEQIISNINQAGNAFLSHTKINNHYTIRMAIGNIASDRDHVMKTWAEVIATAQQIIDPNNHKLKHGNRDSAYA